MHAIILSLNSHRKPQPAKRTEKSYESDKILTGSAGKSKATYLVS